jgi:hypothetical protein
MEISKKTLNSLKVGDFVKVIESDSTISDWKKIDGLQYYNGNVVRVDFNIKNHLSYSYFALIPVSCYVKDIVDIRENFSTNNKPIITHPWTTSRADMFPTWETSELNWNIMTEQIRQDMHEELAKSVKSETFKSITENMLNTYIKKNADYGSSFDKSMDEFGLTAAVVRMSDKMERLKSLSKKDAQVKDESVEDTLLDLANYCIMTVMHLKINEDEE